MDHGEKTQVEKISYLLHSNPEKLNFLSQLSKTELESLHNLIMQRIYAETSPTWEKLAAVARFMPNFINAKISEDILGEEITANLSYHLPAKDSIAVASHLSTRFLAKVVERLVPEKAIPMILDYPMRDLLRIVRELVANEKFYTLGSFIDHLPHEKLHQIAQELDSESDLMQIGKFAGRKDHLAGLISGFDDDRLTKLVEASNNLGLFSEMLEIMGHFTEDDQIRFARISDQFSDEILLNLIAAGTELNLLSEFMNVIARFDEQQQLRIGNLVPQMSDDSLIEFVRAASHTEHANTLLAIAERLDVEQFKRAGPLLSRLSENELYQLANSGYKLKREKTIFLFMKFIPAESQTLARNVFQRFEKSERQDIERMAREAGFLHDIQFLFNET